MLADIVKCYEQVPHDVLLQEAINNHFPLVVLRVCLAFYRATRVLVRDGAVSRDLVATRTIAAGCVHATALLKCLMVRTLDHVVALWGGHHDAGDC